MRFATKFDWNFEFRLNRAINNVLPPTDFLNRKSRNGAAREAKCGLLCDANARCVSAY